MSSIILRGVGGGEGEIFSDLSICWDDVDSLSYPADFNLSLGLMTHDKLRGSSEQKMIFLRNHRQDDK